MSEPPVSLSSQALQGAVRIVRVTLEASASLSHLGEDSQDIIIGNESGEPMDWTAEADDDPFIADNKHKYDGLSDAGSRDEAADQMIPIVSSAVLAQAFICPSSCRFLTRHTRVPGIFELLYGTGSRLQTRTDSLRSCRYGETAQLSTFDTEVYDAGPPYPVFFTSCRQHVVKLLISYDLFSATPSRPQVAFTIRSFDSSSSWST
ncbi:hypothetical protein CF319_g4526 [Tilletia indica]|nr:hypothetical protein CF319_g4526 [Tilletia indica]